MMDASNKSIFSKGSYFIILSIFLFSCGEESKSFTTSELSKLWLFNESIEVEFGLDNSAKSRTFDFFSRFSIADDMITIKHDYGNSECWTYNSNKEKVVCDDWPLPDSKFRVLETSASELTLCPLNSSAMKIAGEIEHPNINYSLESYQNLIDGVKNTEEYSWSPYKIDTLKLRSADSFYSKVEFDSIAISSYQMGWFANYFYDLKLYHSGKFIVNSEVVEFRKRKYEDPNAVVGLFEENLSNAELSDLNHLLSVSGMSQMPSRTFEGWTSHGLEVNMIVYFSDTLAIYKGIEGEFPILIEPVINKLLGINEFERYKPIEINEPFETAFMIE